MTIHIQTTNPRTGICRSLAVLMTSSNLRMLSSIEQLMFFLLKVSDADPNTATSVAPAATLKEGRKKWTCKTVLLESHLRKCRNYVSKKTAVPTINSNWQAGVNSYGLYSRDHRAELKMNAYSILEALHVRCQNRILNMRCSLDSSQHISVVCHLHEGGKTYDVGK